jgi:hypothetical protein
MMTTSRGVDGHAKLLAANESFTRLSNKSANGSLHLSVAMLWQIGRNAMIPKSDGSERPVAIMDGWYRASEWKSGGK